MSNLLIMTDIGNYVDNEDIGNYVMQVKTGTVIGSAGILRWGLAMFGTTGILGYAPSTFQNQQRMNVIRV